MLWFTSSRTPAALRRTRAEADAWLEAAQSAARSIDAQAAIANVDAPKSVRRAGEGIREGIRDASEGIRDGIADATRQVRSTAADLGDDLRPGGHDSLRKSVLMLLPSERRRRSRRRAVMMAVAGLAAASVVGLVLTRLLARRPSVPLLAAEWTPSGQTSASVAGGRFGQMTGVMDPASIAGAPVPAGSGTRADPTVQPRSAGSGSSSAAQSPAGFAGTHPPVGVTPDASTVPGTFDRDAEIRAAGEGMEPPERGVADGE